MSHILHSKYICCQYWAFLRYYLQLTHHNHGCTVYTEHAKTAAASCGTSHITTKPCCKHITLVDIQKCMTKASHSFRLTYDKSTSGLLKFREKCCIKAISNKNSITHCMHTRTHTHMVEHKLQAPAYDILPLTTAIFSYAIGSRKLSANEQFFVGAQTVVCLLQTTKKTQDVSFIAANKVYTSINKTTIVWIVTELSFLPRVDTSHVYMRALALGCFYSYISIQTFRRALTVLVDSCAEIKSAPSVASLNLAEFGGRCRKAVLGVWVEQCPCHKFWHTSVAFDEKEQKRTLTWFVLWTVGLGNLLRFARWDQNSGIEPRVWAHEEKQRTVRETDHMTLIIHTKNMQKFIFQVYMQNWKMNFHMCTKKAKCHVQILSGKKKKKKKRK